ncbi:MAG TPA: hypothetical protein VHI77_04405 [Solirubrobacterales bacterium]|jgi:hypothetical protein|nr:hypothetical protein [Solirubrobacterales bacterium]
MRALAKFIGLGNGKLPAAVRRRLEAEGLVLVEEDLPGSLRYQEFGMPGRRFNGKITGERIGFGISERRVVAYCRSGRANLIDSPFSNPYWEIVEVMPDQEGLELLVDYDRARAPAASGQIRIRMRTSSARRISNELQTRLSR